jgi:chromosome segregation ATPase
MVKVSSKSDAESMEPKAASQIGDGARPEDGAVGVEKIRDLLFGNQIQDYDRRFSSLEERFLQRFKDIASETTHSLGAIESNAKQHIESLANQLRAEKELRADADKDIDRTVREQNQTVEKRLRAMSDQLSQLERDMADRVTQETQSIREEIKRKSEDLQRTIEKMFSELGNVKTDRNLLAGLFLEVAKCLNQDTGPKSVGMTGADTLRGWPS